MIGQQRTILATLGIDVWVPKQSVCQKNPAQSLWRDQVVQHSVVSTTHSPSEHVTEIIECVVPQPVVVEPIVEPEQETAPKIEAVAVYVEPVAAFELQAYCLEHTILVVDATNLNTDQKQLWANIQRAKLGQYAELKWPFPLVDFQDSRGVGAYVQGFLDAHAPEKKILSLGVCPSITSVNMIQLASLQDMLEQPILKKRLWQLMQDKKS